MYVRTYACISIINRYAYCKSTVLQIKGKCLALSVNSKRASSKISLFYGYDMNGDNLRTYLFNGYGNRSYYVPTKTLRVLSSVHVICSPMTSNGDYVYCTSTMMQVAQRLPWSFARGNIMGYGQQQ